MILETGLTGTRIKMMRLCSTISCHDISVAILLSCPNYTSVRMVLVVVLLLSGIQSCNVLGISMCRVGSLMFMRCDIHASIQNDMEKAERFEKIARFSNSVLATTHPYNTQMLYSGCSSTSTSRPRRRFVTTEDYRTQKRYIFDVVESRSLTRSTFVSRE